MAQLSSLNGRLLDLASILPQQQGAASSGRPAARGSPFPIDEMYDLSGDVAKVLERLSKRDFKEDSFLGSSDPGNSMFVLSIYVRLLDLYQRVFSLLRLELPQAKSGSRFKLWKLPDVTVGTFTIDSIPTLQLSLTVQLGEELLSRLRKAIAGLLPDLRNDEEQAVSGAADGNSMFSEVVDVSSRAMKTKGESLAKALAEFRDEIEESLAA